MGGEHSSRFLRVVRQSSPDGDVFRRRQRRERGTDEVRVHAEDVASVWAAAGSRGGVSWVE